MNRNYKAALSYVGSYFTGILFLAIEKDDEFVRKSAAQSFVLGIAQIIVHGSLIALPIIGHGFVFAFNVLFVLLIVFLVVKALNNIYFKLPIISDISERYVVSWFK